jgi:hypothetical protein
MTAGQSGAGNESDVPSYNQRCSTSVFGDTRRRDCLALACQAWACQHADVEANGAGGAGPRSTGD